MCWFRFFHLLKRVTSTWTALYMVEVWPFAIWILLTHPSMLPHALLHPISLVTVRAEESLIRLWSPNAMCHLLVLFQDGSTSIGPLADIAVIPLPLFTGLLMLP